MATAASLSFNVESRGSKCTVPDDDLAKVMYYLHCVTVGVGIDILQDDLVDYRNYRRLTATRIAAVLKCALELSPDELVGKLIFIDDDRDICREFSNEFLTISAACNVVSIQRGMVIAGKVQGQPTNVMFCKSSWITNNYTRPLERIAQSLVSKHCDHCRGNEGNCACRTCPRKYGSKCRPQECIIC